jgi:hypothetical protein
LLTRAPPTTTSASLRTGCMGAPQRTKGSHRTPGEDVREGARTRSTCQNLRNATLTRARSDHSPQTAAPRSLFRSAVFDSWGSPLFVQRPAAGRYLRRWYQSSRLGELLSEVFDRCVLGFDRIFRLDVRTGAFATAQDFPALAQSALAEFTVDIRRIRSCRRTL